ADRRACRNRTHKVRRFHFTRSEGSQDTGTGAAVDYCLTSGPPYTDKPMWRICAAAGSGYSVQVTGRGSPRGARVTPRLRMRRLAGSLPYPLEPPAAHPSNAAGADDEFDTIDGMVGPVHLRLASPRRRGCRGWFAKSRFQPANPTDSVGIV